MSEAVVEYLAPRFEWGCGMEHFEARDHVRRLLHEGRIRAIWSGSAQRVTLPKLETGYDNRGASGSAAAGTYPYRGSRRGTIMLPRSPFDKRTKKQAAEIRPVT